MWDKFPPPPDPGLEAAFHQFVADHAAAHGWTKGYTATIQRGIRIMLGIQDTPGAPIRRSDILLLTRIKHSATTVTEVIAAAGMLEDDIEPPVVRWFRDKTAALPEQMRRELDVWLDVMRNGSTTPPRSKPRAEGTIRAQLAFALPTLRSWAARSDSLRDRVVLLAQPAREHVAAYLSYRAATWPASVNVHLFIHARNWKTIRPVTSAWIGQQLAISAEHIRLDRIYQEVEATGGDIRALCDLFGMSIANAARWAAAADRIRDASAEHPGP